MSDADQAGDVIVYLRCRSTELLASNAAMDEQRGMLASWLAAHTKPVRILAEFIEEEGEGVARPALAKAIAACKTQGATLVVISTASIGTGSVFEPRIASVPVMVLPQPKKTIPSLIPLPPRSGPEVSLYVGAVRNGQIPVYLGNPTATPLIDVTIFMGGFYTAVRRDESLIPIGCPSASYARIEPMTAQLIETRNIMSEGESIDHIRIRFSQGGEKREGAASLFKLFDPHFIQINFSRLRSA
jgi:hypothetical protein